MVQRSTRPQIPRLRRRARRTGPEIAPPTWVSGPEGETPEPPDDLDGGAGVREPRRPSPTTPTASVARELAHPVGLDLTSTAGGR